MNEDAKGDSVDKRVRAENLAKMKETVNLAKYYIVRFNLYEWEHRLYRFLGRVSDYEGDYKRATNYYKRSIKSAKRDPDYEMLGYPRWLEAEAFLSYSLIMSGQTGKGHIMALELYEKFSKDKEALFLKEKDFTTWAIWKTGIPVRTVDALIDKKVVFNKKEALSWVIDAEKIIKGGESKKTWSGFEYRLRELEAVKNKLRNFLN